MADLIIDLSNIEARDGSRAGGGKVLPDGWYKCIIEYGKTDYVPCSGGNRLKAEIAICTEGYDRRKIFESLVLDHTNQDTVEIAKAALKELAIAVEVNEPNSITDTAVLEGTYFYARLYRRREANAKYSDADGMRQEIGAYLSTDAFIASDEEEAVHPSRARTDQRISSPASRERAHVANSALGAGSEPPEGEEPPPPGDDDIPF